MPALPCRLGNVLYLAYIFFADSPHGPFADFTGGLLLGLSVATNLVGIVLAAAHCKNPIGKTNKKSRHMLRNGFFLPKTA